MTDSSWPGALKDRGQPETFRARSLSASLTVKDLQRSLEWYRDAVGFHPGKQYERDGKVFGIVLEAGTAQILITQDDGARGLDRAKGDGFSLHFTTTQSVDELAARIKAHGTTLDMEPTDMPWGARSFRVRDPDGFRIAISSAP
ncbi:MAG TPA: VOC family protein [Gemmatimonadaceae bacterium]